MEENLRIESCQMTEVEVGIEVIREDLGGIEETVDLGIEIDPTVVIKMKGEGDSTVENQDI